jgi:hypothetical protein
MTPYNVWRDGYGRSHATDGRPAGAPPLSRPAPAESGPAARLDPWHAYDDHRGLENGY